MAAPVLDYEAPPDEEGAPPPIRTFDSDADAAKYVQRKWRGRKIRKLLKMFPSLDQLKEMYLDPKARAAGAADSKWYTAQALKAREHVRLSAEIEENCNHAWQCVIEASRHWVAVTAAEAARKAVTAVSSAYIEARVEEAVSALSDGLTKDAYAVMSRKLYMMSKLLEDDVDFNSNDMMATANEDWEDDAGGASILSKDAFKRCWFQLVDLYTEHINAEDYVEWANDCLETITVVDEHEWGSRRWREDAELLDRFEPRQSAAEQSAFDAKRRHWQTTFAPIKSMSRVARAASSLLQGHGPALQEEEEDQP